MYSTMRTGSTTRSGSGKEARNVSQCCGISGMLPCTGMRHTNGGSSDLPSRAALETCTMSRAHSSATKMVAQEFASLDRDRDGWVSALHCADALVTLGYDMSISQALSLFREAGCPSNGYFDVVTFSRLRRILVERYPNGPHGSRVRASQHHTGPESLPPTGTQGNRGYAPPQRSAPEPNAPSFAPPSLDTLPNTAASHRPTPSHGGYSAAGTATYQSSRHPHTNDYGTQTGTHPSHYDGRPPLPSEAGTARTGPIPPPDQGTMGSTAPHTSGGTAAHTEEPWVNAGQGFLYKKVPERPPHVFFMEGGIRDVAAKFPTDHAVVCTFSTTQGSHVLLRRK
eukprot:GGOE01054093.1.p1 GENE.GGOE01054093.1~~GGOE01054093.1.p1  ORF type:complete len:339 (+),score=66.82 GGOE01054093.1:127-1143(+)